MKKDFTLLLLCAMSQGISAQDMVEVTNSEISLLNRTKNHQRVSVHDPSIVDTGTGTYYIFGTHNAVARSTDLINWSGVDNSRLYGLRNSNGVVTATDFNNAFEKNMTTKVTALVNGVAKEVKFGNFNCEEWMTANNTTVAGNIWAPDVIWNKDMKKWCMYLSLNGNTWSSVIVLLTASNIEGPYVYEGPVVYSGFINGTNERISWKKTDLELVIGTQSTLPSRYNRGGDWGTFWPNNIDPCVLYDEEGQLWMSYGSWSGGIFMLKLDNKTGLRDYLTTYPLVTDGGGRATSDPYFGKRIAGGYYVSGEGSYIQHIGDYYYLFMTYGGLESNKGYVMRSFRSNNVDGPYTDAKGKSAIFSWYEMNYGTNDANTVGNLLMSSYNGLGFQTTGEVAQGHNSAFVDSKNRNFLIYHTRFTGGGEGFQDRVHQLFVNKKGWLCAAPFEFDGETLTDDSIKANFKYTSKDILGEYQFMQHRYKLNNEARECVTPVTVTLTEDGKVTGGASGTWSLTDGTGYITVKLGNVTYDGVVCDQTVDGYQYKSIAITGLSTTGTVLWGWKMAPSSAIAYTVKNSTSNVKSGNVVIHQDFNYDTYYGTVSQWISSNEEVLTNDGKYNPADENIDVTLIHRLTNGNRYYDETYKMKVLAATETDGDYKSGLAAYYNFDEKPITNMLDTEQSATLSKQSGGTMPELAYDIARFGQTMYVKGGDDADKTCGVVRMGNPLYGQTDMKGMSISFWVKRLENDLWGTLFAFVNTNPAFITKQNNLSFSGNTYLAFDNGTDTFAVNYPNVERTVIESGKWKFVTITIAPEDGVKIYVNKIRRSNVFASTAGTSAKDFDFQKVLDLLSASQYLCLGKGNGHGGASALYDDLFVHNRALTSDDVGALYAAVTRVTDFEAELSTGIHDVFDDQVERAEDGAWYTIQGQRLTNKPQSKGIYIHHGKKVLVK